ncbi:MAG TPA: thioredoxin [Bacteroidales bacterium]|nr:thioredoxin [Bacteroidales bacterium]
MKETLLRLIPLLIGLNFIAFGISAQSSIKKTENEGKVIYLTSAEFKEKVFNWEKSPDTWVFEGERPCVVDFYADWCKPCRIVAPIMEELALKYQGKVTIYKVNTDKEKEVANAFGIRAIPSVLFCPMKGKPQMATGALPKDSYIEVIEEFLLGNNKSSL